MNQDKKPTIAAIIEGLRESHAATTQGQWSKGKTTHQTVAKRQVGQPYHVAEFRHADDADFCERAHASVPKLLEYIAELEAQLSAIGAGGGWMPPAVRELIDRLQDAQQDINLAANTHMSQQLASAAALLDEVESTLRALSATQPAAQGLDARDAARYRWLRDNDWRNDEKMEPVIRLHLNAIWDEKIDAAMAAQAKQREQ